MGRVGRLGRALLRETYATEFKPQNFAAIAAGAGIRAWRAETPEQVIPALQEAFAYSRPAVIDVVVARQELSLPPTITLAQAAGFNLYMLKAMLHGHGHKVLDMETVMETSPRKVEGLSENEVLDLCRSEVETMHNVQYLMSCPDVPRDTMQRYLADMRRSLEHLTEYCVGRKTDLE